MPVQTIPPRIRWAVELMDVQPADQVLEIGCGPGAGAELICARLETGRLFAIAAGASELASGMLIASGFLGPVGPALMLSVMIVAAISVHWQNGLFSMSNGIELPLLYAAAAAALALTGPGTYSLDGLLGLSSLWTPGLAWSALGLGILGGIGNLALRQPSLDAVPA